MKKIYFYFDFLSPFSYFAWENHKKKLLNNSQLDVVYSPVLMGRLFSHFEFKGPGEIPPKREYELKKCFRYAAKRNIPFSPPKEHPFNPLAIIRLATLFSSNEDQFKIIDFIFKSIWANGLVLEDPELISNLLQKNYFDHKIFDRSFERDAKLELKANIKQAISQGIFGVPTFTHEEEIFWGNDSLNDLRDYLEGNDIWNKELYTALLNK